MLSIHTNISALYTYRHLQNNSVAMGKSMEKLSSGYRINTAADGPADLIISEKLRAQIEGLERAVRNTNETKNLLSISEGALGEVQNILRNMKKLAVGAANTGIVTADQIAADQAQMDAALQAIDRILGTTSYAGRKLLDNLNLGGNPGAHNAANVVATPDTVGSDAKNNLVDAGMVQRAALNETPQVDENGLLVEGDKTFTVRGQDPEAAPLAELTFSEGGSIDDVVAALKAIAIPDAEKVVPGADYAPPQSRYGGDINAIGLDVATLTHIQGLSDADAAEYMKTYMQNHSPVQPLGLELGESLEDFPGRKLSDREREMYDLTQTLQNMGSGGSIGGVEVTKRFSLDGPVETRTLYLADLWGGGAASLANDPAAAMKILDQAIKDIAGARAQIGAVQANQFQAMENVMQAEIENLTRSESAIRDTDFASEMITFTRTQIFAQVGTKMLAAANEQGQHILDLIA